jgi:hypothetical protein
MHVFLLAPRRCMSEGTDMEAGVRFVQWYAVSIVCSSIKCIAMTRVEDITRSWFVLNHSLHGGGPFDICLSKCVVLTVFPLLRKWAGQGVNRLEIGVNQSNESELITSHSNCLVDVRERSIDSNSWLNRKYAARIVVPCGMAQLFQYTGVLNRTSIHAPLENAFLWRITMSYNLLIISHPFVMGMTILSVYSCHHHDCNNLHIPKWLTRFKRGIESTDIANSRRKAFLSMNSANSNSCAQLWIFRKDAKTKAMRWSMTMNRNAE